MSKKGEVYLEIGKQLPEITIDKFYEYCKQGKLMAAKCLKCNKVIFPPRPLCPYCYSKDVTWTELKKEGKIVSYTIIHVAPPQFQNLVPYAVAVVETEDVEGLGKVKVIGMVKDVKDPKQIDVGDKVVIDFEPVKWDTWPYDRPRIIFKKS